MSMGSDRSPLGQEEDPLRELYARELEVCARHVRAGDDPHWSDAFAIAMRRAVATENKRCTDIALEFAERFMPKLGDLTISNEHVAAIEIVELIRIKSSSSDAQRSGSP